MTPEKSYISEKMHKIANICPIFMQQFSYSNIQCDEASESALGFCLARYTVLKIAKNTKMLLCFTSAQVSLPNRLAQNNRKGSD